MNDEEISKMLDDTMQKLLVESAEIIYNAGYNAAIEAAANKAFLEIMDSEESFEVCAEIRKLKK